MVFSYDCGTAWMDGQGVVKTAVVNKAGANELLNAMHQWTKGSDMDRRRIEVNMYCNGKYSNVPPTSYAEVTYDPNGGSIAAMHQWTKGSDMDRRRIEVNMYCNGKYSNVPPTSYAEVTYDPNGGSIAQNQGDPNGTYKFYFDTSQWHLQVLL